MRIDMPYKYQDRTRVSGGGYSDFRIRRGEGKRKRASDDDNYLRPQGRRFDSPHSSTGWDRGQSGSRTVNVKSIKRAKHEQPNTTAGSSSTESTPDSITAAAPTLSPPIPRSSKRRRDKEDNGDKERGSDNRVSRRYTLLEKAQQRAADYPPLDDARAWQSLSKETNKKIRNETAFVYRHLRRDQCPKSLSYKEWCKRVHREMESLGLEDVGDAGEKDTPAGETASAEEEGPFVDEVKYEDDGFDIDIYGGEETRLKYEPWIRSQMGRG